MSCAQNTDDSLSLSLSNYLSLTLTLSLSLSRPQTTMVSLLCGVHKRPTMGSYSLCLPHSLSRSHAHSLPRSLAPSLFHSPTLALRIFTTKTA